MTSEAATFQPTIQRGYIVSPSSDRLWFLGLPFLAIAVAIAAEAHLPALWVVLVSAAVTVPHQGVTFLRVFPSRSERSRWPRRLIAGPLILIPGVYFMTTWNPWLLILIVTLWDHQHSIMQQYGFARIYDHKAGSGAELTPKFDFYLNWVLFVNLLLVTDLWTRFWVRLFAEVGVQPTVAFVDAVQTVSWSVTIAFVVAYTFHVVRSVRDGHAINPTKYLFIAASYFLWYFMAYSTQNMVVFSIAHRIMHGVQYIVMVYFYNLNIVQRTGGDSKLLQTLGKPGPKYVAAFVGLLAIYAVGFWQLTLARGFSPDYDIFAASLITSFALLHYYMDAFIWKIRKPELAGNL